MARSGERLDRRSADTVSVGMGTEPGQQAGARQNGGADVRIEPYAPADALAVLRLAQFCVAHPEEQIGAPLWLTREELARELRTWQVPPARSLFVAREGATVVGVAGVDCYPGTRMCQLNGPIVAPGSRGKGIGGSLLRIALRAARWHGMSEIWGSAGRENVRAERIAIAEGFSKGETNAVYRLERRRHRPLPEGNFVGLRRVGPGDREALALVEACGQTAQLPLEGLVAALADPAQHVFVGSLEGETAGLVVVDTAEQWVYGLTTLPPARERGFGAALLSKAVETFWHEHPEDWLGLTVRIDNLTAINLYRRQGFEPWLVLTNWSRAL
jgi:ribosomal protein S18 acetylase RimI-like enzyme